MTLTEIATALGLAKSSTANLCLALEAAVMVQRVPLGYQLGAARRSWGARSPPSSIRSASSTASARLRRCSCTRSFRLRCSMGATRSTSPARGIRGRPLGTPLGSRLPAALGATGRALLMRLEDAEVTALLSDSVPFPR